MRPESDGLVSVRLYGQRCVPSVLDPTGHQYGAVATVMLISHEKLVAALEEIAEELAKGTDADINWLRDQHNVISATVDVLKHHGGMRNVGWAEPFETTPHWK